LIFGKWKGKSSWLKISKLGLEIELLKRAGPGWVGLKSKHAEPG